MYETLSLFLIIALPTWMIAAAFITTVRWAFIKSDNPEMSVFVGAIVAIIAGAIAVCLL